MYLAAKQATELETSYSNSDTRAQKEVGDKFEEQIDKVIYDLRHFSNYMHGVSAK